MGYNLTIDDKNLKLSEEIIEIVDSKIGIKVPKNRLIPLLLKNPKLAAEIVLQNIKNSA